MEYTLEERANRIIQCCEQNKSKNPYFIFKEAADKDYVRIHGPEHHVLDGASILTAYFNAGGDIDLNKCLKELLHRGMQMPGATCGMWGVCGAVSSMGAALSIIDGTGPLSSDDSWGSHMLFTSEALGRLARIGGPRCCKRDAFLAFDEAEKYINQNYKVQLESQDISCTYYEKNEQCLGSRCPFSPGGKRR